MSSGRRGRDGPPLWLTALEGRALIERGAIGALEPWLRRVRRGDGHPVLVLPGFTANDRSTGPLRSILRGQGYWTHGWRLGPNLGPTPHVVEGLVRRFDVLQQEHDQPISLIGWSLGGIFARELARAFPQQVRQVITLGSPFRINEGDRSAASGLYERLRPLHALDRVPPPPEETRPRLAMPATAIYTRTDGIVRWWQCVEADGPHRETIAVRGSHSGLGFNPAAVYAVSDRLAQPVGAWQPFAAPAWARGWYPRAVGWRPAPRSDP